MARIPGSIAAERAWAPLGRGSRHAGVGAPSFCALQPERPSPLPFLFGRGVARWCGGRFGVRVRLQGGGLILARSLTCHTVRNNRNACVPLTLERQSVNVLTCEFPHRIGGFRKADRVSWGEKEGGDEEPDRPGRPAQRERHGKPENNPPTRTRPAEPATNDQPRRTHGRTRATNENSNHDPRLRTTQPEHNQQDKPPTRPAHPIRKELQPTDSRQPADTTTQQRDDPNREPQPTKRMGGGVKEGSKGNSPPGRHRPPTGNQDPPAEHPHPPDTPTPEPDPDQKPSTGAGTPTTLPPPHHPAPHRVPCTHAMDHIRPTSTPANELEQNQEASPRESEIQMPRPGPGNHTTPHQQGRDKGTPTVASPGMRQARNRRRPHQRRRQPRTK